MTSAELFGLAYYGALAFGAAVVLLIVQGAFLSLEIRLARWTLSAVPALLCLGIAISALLSGRSLKLVSVDVRTIGSVDGAGSGSIMRGITAVVLALCFAKIVTRLMQIRARHEPPMGGRGLFLSLLAFFASSHLLSATLGAHPVFVHNSYYSIIVFAAVFMARDESVDRALDSLKLALMLFMLGSLVAAIAAPSLALQTDYAGWIPGFNVRLWGLGSHANSIGPLALLLGLLLYYRAFPKPWLNKAAWGALLIVFVLAQSKTVWAAGAVCLAVLGFYGRGRDAQGRLKMGFVLGLMVVALALFSMLVAVDVGRIASEVAASKVGGELATLTGRTTIWLEAWRIWMDHFWFGYGPDAWGPLHRARIGMPFAFHAHNQLMQSLSSAGLFGGISLLVYLGCMLAASWRAAACTRGVSLALAVLMLARAMSEAPLELAGLFIGETLIHLAWFTLVLLPYARSAPAAEAALPGGRPTAAIGASLRGQSS